MSDDTAVTTAPHCKKNGTTGVSEHARNDDCFIRKGVLNFTMRPAAKTLAYRPVLSPCQLRPPPLAPHPAQLMLGALGVVFGDIGTSPIYALRQGVLDAGAATSLIVMGVLSTIVWAVVGGGRL
jgi:hypothetical protein